MKIIHSLLFLVVWVETEALMKREEFIDKILPYCFKRREEIQDMGHEPLVMPRSIESFIGLVEKLERYPSEQAARLNIQSVIRELLQNFRYDDLDYDQEGRSFRTRGTTGVTKSHEMTQNILRDAASSTFNMREVYTMDEQCALFFMLSHTVNTTVREGESSEQTSQGKFLATFPVEQGVVSLESDQYQAFSLGKVLLGLLAGLREPNVMTSSQIYAAGNANAGSLPAGLENSNIDNLFAVTFGDLVAVPYTESGWKGDFKFQSSGYWKEIVCPIDYVLDGKNKKAHGTVSAIRGALDGYALGKRVKTLMLKSGFLRLSQILRMYYSGNGFTEIPELSVCSRIQLWNDFKSEMVEKAVGYIDVHMHMTDQIQNDRNIITEYCNKMINNVIGREPDQIFGNIPVQRCAVSPSSANLLHETPFDVFAIIDYKTEETKKTAQNEIIGNITSGFNMRKDGSSVSVFTNLKTVKIGFNLDTIINGSHISGCGSCAAKHYEPRSMLTAESELEVIKDLNRTLTTVTETEEEKSGVPGKVILYFNFNNPRPDHQMRHAVWETQYNFRDANLFAIGSEAKALWQFVRDQARDVFVYGVDDVQTLIESLQKRIVKVPAAFQFKDCDQENTGEGTYDGYLSVHRYQYWAMYPKYFLKSFNIKLTFKSLSGAYKVCFSRSYGSMFDTIPPRERNCFDVKPTGEPAVFTVSNPCHRKNLETCEPFYFYLEGKTLPEDPCEGFRCATPDQIRFQFSHEGISCNGASSLSTALLLSAILAITLLCHHFRM